MVNSGSNDMRTLNAASRLGASCIQSLVRIMTLEFGAKYFILTQNALSQLLLLYVYGKWIKLY